MKKETTKKILIGVAVTAVLSIGFQGGQSKQERIETPKPIIVQEQKKELNKEALQENVEELRGQHLSMFLTQNGMGKEFINMQRYANLRGSLYKQSCQLITKLREGQTTTNPAKLQELVQGTRADVALIEEFTVDIAQQGAEAKKEGEDKIIRYAKENNMDLGELIEALKKADELDTKELEGRASAIEKETNILLDKAREAEQAGTQARLKELEEEHKREAERLGELHRKEIEKRYNKIEEEYNKAVQEAEEPIIEETEVFTIEEQ